jgi:putative hemolysin
VCSAPTIIAAIFHKFGFIVMNSQSIFLLNTAAAVVLTTAMSACASQQSAQGPNRVGLANPASKYCISLGGKRETRKDAAGNQSSVCHLPDGTTIDEWALYRRDHRQP